MIFSSVFMLRLYKQFILMWMDSEKWQIYTDVKFVCLTKPVMFLVVSANFFMMSDQNRFRVYVLLFLV